MYFQIAHIFFHFSQLKEVTVKNIFTNFTKHLEASALHWNVVTSLALDFVKELNHSLGNSSRGPIGLTSYNNDWIYLNSIRSFYEVLLDDQFKVQNIGSFMILTSNMINFYDCPYYEQLKTSLHELFKIEEKKLSLPDIGFMYSIENHNILQTYINTNPDQWKHSSKYWFPPMYPNINESFKDCFLHGSKDQQFEESIDGDFLSGKDIQLSPCLDIKQSTTCQDYCKWHSDVIQNWKKSNFLALMKTILPPRKLVPEPLQAGEIDLLTKLFEGSKSLKNKSQLAINFASPIIFCYDRSDGLTGDEVGPSSKFCNDFFPTPTDTGLCLTKNLDLKAILHPNSIYNSMFEPSLRPEPKAFKGNTLWTEMTLVLFPDVDNNFRQSIE